MAEEQPAVLCRSDYEDFCRALGREPAQDAMPAFRRADVPTWMSRALIATEHARGRLRRWVELGQPVPSARDIGLRLRFDGAGSTLDLVTACLASGAVSVPAVWDLLERGHVMAMGRDCVGMCTRARRGVERIVLFADIASDEQAISRFLHELAHHWLLASPPTDLTPEEEVLVSGPDFWRTAARLGLFEERIDIAMRDETQACRLAAAWGATGSSIDPRFCAGGAASLAHAEAQR